VEPLKEDRVEPFKEDRVEPPKEETIKKNFLRCYVCRKKADKDKNLRLHS